MFAAWLDNPLTLPVTVPLLAGRENGKLLFPRDRRSSAVIPLSRRGAGWLASPPFSRVGKDSPLSTDGSDPNAPTPDPQPDPPPEPDIDGGTGLGGRLLDMPIEEELKEAGVAYRKGLFDFRANSRARCLEQTEGRVKILLSGGGNDLIDVGNPYGNDRAGFRPQLKAQFLQFLI